MLLTEKMLRRIIKVALLSENLSPADAKALEQAAYKSRKEFLKVYKTVFKKYHPDILKGAGKSLEVQARGAGASNQIANIKKAYDAGKLGPNASKTLAKTIITNNAHSADDFARNLKALGGKTQTVTNPLGDPVKKTGQTGSKAASQTGSKAAGKATSGAAKGVINKAPSQKAVKTATSIMQKNPAVKNQIVKGLTTATNGKYPLAVIEKAAPKLLAHSVERGTSTALVRTGGTQIVKTVSLRFIPMAIGLPAMAGVGKILGAIIGWPGLAATVGWYAGGALHDWMVGDTKDLFNSIKRDAKQRLGLLVGPSGYDFTDDKEFTDAALEKNFNGLDPNDIDVTRKQQIFDLLIARSAMRQAGQSIDKINGNEEIKKAYKLIEAGYLSDKWFAAAKKASQVTNIRITSGKELQDEGEQSEETPKSTKTKGWQNHPPELKTAWKEFLDSDPDYKRKHGPRGGTYVEWQRWYMNATKNPEAWELIKVPKRKYLNNKETIKLLSLLADPSKIELEPGQDKT